MSAERERFDSYYAGFLGGKLFRCLDVMKVRIARAILRKLGEHPRAIELGCGGGGVAARLAREGVLPAGDFPGEISIMKDYLDDVFRQLEEFRGKLVCNVSVEGEYAPKVDEKKKKII